jgi:hypothetical protein
VEDVRVLEGAWGVWREGGGEDSGTMCRSRSGRPKPLSLPPPLSSLPPFLPLSLPPSLFSSLPPSPGGAGGVVQGPVFLPGGADESGRLPSHLWDRHGHSAVVEARGR